MSHNESYDTSVVLARRDLNLLSSHFVELLSAGCTISEGATRLVSGALSPRRLQATHNFTIFSVSTEGLY